MAGAERWKPSQTHRAMVQNRRHLSSLAGFDWRSNGSHSLSCGKGIGILGNEVAGAVAQLRRRATADGFKG